jgi:hypothetical protein
MGELNTAVDPGNASQTDIAEADDAPFALQAFAARVFIAVAAIRPSD